MSNQGTDGRDPLSGGAGSATMEIVRYLGYRIMTQAEPVSNGYRATSWVVRIDAADAPVRPAGSAIARTEAEAIREAQSQARVALELALEDEALLKREE